MSENSSARTCVMARDSAETIEREALGDAAGVDAGAVQRDAAVRGTPPRAPRRRRAAHGKNQPSGVTTFLPERRMRDHLVRVGEIGL